jgi:predicted amidophosphoribosyltransferase
MKCGYCGYDFPEEEGIRGCGGCGRPESCHMVRCPRCYYENPQELKVIKKIKKLMENKKQET